MDVDFDPNTGDQFVTCAESRMKAMRSFNRGLYIGLLIGATVVAIII